MAKKRKIRPYKRTRDYRIRCKETGQVFDTIEKTIEWLMTLPKCKTKNPKTLRVTMSNHLNKKPKIVVVDGRKFVTGIYSIYGYSFERIKREEETTTTSKEGALQIEIPQPESNQQQ